MTYNTSGTCSRVINFDVVDGVVHNVDFLGGCEGNLHAVCKLVEGKSAKDVIALLKGTPCGGRGTSCPDQLAKALEAATARAA
jgi:uncharacterized protein (TIGR03905 family)